VRPQVDHGQPFLYPSLVPSALFSFFSFFSPFFFSRSPGRFSPWPFFFFLCSVSFCVVLCVFFFLWLFFYFLFLFFCFCSLLPPFCLRPAIRACCWGCHAALVDSGLAARAVRPALAAHADATLRGREDHRARTARGARPRDGPGQRGRPRPPTSPASGRTFQPYARGRWSRMSYLHRPAGLEEDHRRGGGSVRAAALLACPAGPAQMYGYDEPPPPDAERRRDRQDLGVRDPRVFLGERVLDGPAADHRAGCDSAARSRRRRREVRETGDCRGDRATVSAAALTLLRGSRNGRRGSRLRPTRAGAVAARCPRGRALRDQPAPGCRSAGEHRRGAAQRAWPCRRGGRGRHPGTIRAC